METTQFIAYLNKSGIEGSLLGETHPVLVGMLAKSWHLTLIFGRLLDKAFIGDWDGKAVSESEGLVLRQIAALHGQYRLSISRLAPNDLLRRIGEDKVASIMLDQMPVTASMASILREAHQLVSTDSLSALSFLKSNAIDFNQKDRDGLTSCAVAAQSGADKCVFALCKNLANPHITDSMGNTPLHWACAMVQAKAASVLLYHGVNPNAVSDNGVTPLMLVLNKSNIDLAQKLLEYGADIRMKDRRGNGALHRAVLTRNAMSVKFLIDCGAAVDEVNIDGQTPMGIGMRDVEMARIFIAERSKSVLVHSMA